MAEKKTKKIFGIKLPEIKSRPKPSAPRAGFRVDGSRYGKGGRIKK